MQQNIYNRRHLDNRFFIMLKIPKHIEIVSSRNTHLSSMSEKSRQAIHNVLKRYYTHVGITLVDTQEGLQQLTESAPDVVFLGMKYVPTRDNKGTIWVTKYLDDYGIAYTGSNHNAHRLELHKHLAKQEVLNADLLTSPFCVIPKNSTQAIIAEHMHYPLFVKPNNLGGGAGIDADSIVHNSQELFNKTASISKIHHTDSLIEQYLPGREFSVALMRDGHTNELMTMPIELCADPGLDGEQVISSATKSANTEVVMPLREDAVKDAVCELARDAFNALGGRDYGRIDIRADKHGKPHFLEANLLPSLIEGYGSFPKACAINEGIGYESMVLSITQLGLDRTGQADDPIRKQRSRNSYVFAT